MADFYIKRLTITGAGKVPSVVEFSKGLNIIFGPSDTGKSYVAECIDFMFGAKTIRFDPNTGYDTFTLLVVSDKGNVTLERKLDRPIIRVSSQRPDIDSGEYTAKWAKGSKRDDVSDVWLRLMGIAENHEIIKNSRRDKVRLTLRLFSHIFLVKEDAVLQERSLIAPTQNTVEPAAFSALYFLVTGEDFSETTPKEEKKIREARKKAVIDYMNSRLADFAEKKSALAQLPSANPEELQTEVERMIEELNMIERQISAAIGRSKVLMQEAYELSGELSECNALGAHFKDLHSQYTADILRAEMIVDGETHRHGIEDNKTCPYCESKMPPRKVESHTASTKKSIATTEGLLADLLVAQSDLNAKRYDILSRISVLENERTGVDELISRQLRPKAETLKLSLKEYRYAIEIRKEVSVLDALATDLKSAIFRKMSEGEETDAGFSIKKHYDGEFFRVMDEYVNRLLIAAEYLNIDTAYVGHSDFDLWVNGQEKRIHGKGFRAFQNTIMALALLEFLSQNGKHSPSMLIVDSPIQSLEESIDQKTPDVMKTGLFKYLLEHQNNGQVIIIENKIPPTLDYSSANMVEFTKGKKPGRYGLLDGVKS